MPLDIIVDFGSYCDTWKTCYMSMLSRAWQRYNLISRAFGKLHYDRGETVIKHRIVQNYHSACRQKTLIEHYFGHEVSIGVQRVQKKKVEHLSIQQFPHLTNHIKRVAID